MTLRRPLALLVPLAACAALLVGCGDDGDGDEAGPGDRSSVADSPSPTTDDDPATGVPSTSDGSDPADPADPSDGDSDDSDDDSDGPSGSPKVVPADAQEMCGVFETAYTAVIAQASNYPTDPDDRVPAELLSVMRGWGQGLADADKPGDLTGDESDGIDLISELLLDLPDDATGRDFEALEKQLDDGDNDKIEAAGQWVVDTCDVDL